MSRPAVISLLIVLLLLSTVRAAKPSPTPQPECTWEPDPGTCRGFFRRYFYNRDSQSCEVFVHGGCGGQVPFRTNQQCEAAHCELLPVSRLKKLPAFVTEMIRAHPQLRVLHLNATTVVT